MRLVYYSLACLGRGNSERRWTRSVQSLRKHNESVEVVLFVYGTPSAHTLAVAESCAVDVRWCGDYTSSFCDVPTHWATALSRYPTLHKFLSLRGIPETGIEQVLYLDCDTYFLADVEQLFARYSVHSFYGREETLSRRSHRGYDGGYVDEELLEDIARKEGLAWIPPYNTGVCLLNNGVWRELGSSCDDFCRYVMRLLTGASLWRPEVVKDEALVPYVLQSASDAELRAALRYPSRNGWIIEEIAWWLTLGQIQHLTHDAFQRSDVAQDGEYQHNPTFIVAHYYSSKESHFFKHIERLSDMVPVTAASTAPVTAARVASSHGQAARSQDSGLPEGRRHSESASGGPLSSESVRALFRTARQAIAEALSGCGAGRAQLPLRVESPYYTVNLTVYQDRRLCASMGGRGESLDAAVSAAARRASIDRRFGGTLLPGHIDVLRLDLWVLTGVVPFGDANDVLTTLDIGLDGVEFRLGLKTAYYKPSVPLTSGITDPEQLMRKLAKKAGLAPGDWRDPRARIWRTSWEHFVDAPALARRPMRLRRLRPLETPAVDPASLTRAVRTAQERLLAGQAESGTYLYEYQPLTNEVPAKASSVVRQAGTTYAIARSAAREPDPLHAAALRRSALGSLDLLLGLLTPAVGGGCFIREPAARLPRGTLGAAALTLLALQFGEFGEACEQAKRSLRTWLLNQQNSDGSFRCWSNTVSITTDGRKQNYFPGEAMLALAHEARRGSASCTMALERGFSWYQSYFRRSPASAFVPWQVDAWRLFAEGTARQTNPAPLAAFVFELADWVLQRQLNAGNVTSEIAGGFAVAGRAPGYSTATYTEAVIRAFDLAMRVGDGERASRYRIAARRGLCFALRLQISPETAEIFPVPSLAVGGVTTRLDDFALRCDYDQHLITACLTALETPRLLD